MLLHPEDFPRHRRLLGRRGAKPELCHRRPASGACQPSRSLLVLLPRAAWGLSLQNDPFDKAVPESQGWQIPRGD